MIAKIRAQTHNAAAAHASLRLMPDRLILAYVRRSAFALAFTALIFPFAALTGMLLRGTCATGMADDVA
jgi:type IV secretory pathway ATPase VirB11/archaellum biosynthesis ATPase